MLNFLQNNYFRVDRLAIVDRIIIHSKYFAKRTLAWKLEHFTSKRGSGPGDDVSWFAVESRLSGDRHSFYRYHQTHALEHFALSMTPAERIQVVAQCFDRYEEERKAEDSRLPEAIMRNIVNATL
jgi:hypothetical protein